MINSKITDLTGKIFGRLTIIKLDKVVNYCSYWLAKCSCGNVISARRSNLINGHIQSCGCLSHELRVQRGKDNKIHGMEGTRFYRIWHGMKGRCLNPNDKDYPKYGGKLCERWFEFLNFRNDLYNSYVKHVEEFGEENTSLDRFPNQIGNYELSNVRWATREEQQQNTRMSAKTGNYEKHIYWKNRIQDTICQALKRQTNSPILEQYVGCNLNDLRKHIESQFQEGMTWNNHGRSYGQWQIDHIIGCNNFDLSNEAERKQCFYYVNLRPMWKEDHVKKSVRRLQVTKEIANAKI